MPISPTSPITKTTPYVGGSSDSRRNSMQSTGSEMEVDRVTASDADHSSLSSAHSSFAADQSYTITPALLGNTPTHTEITSSHDLKIILEQIQHDFVNFKSEINVHNIFVCEDYNKILGFIDNSTAENNTTSPWDSNTSFHKLCIYLFDTFSDIFTYSEFWQTFYLPGDNDTHIGTLQSNDEIPTCFTYTSNVANPDIGTSSSQRVGTLKAEENKTGIFQHTWSDTFENKYQTFIGNKYQTFFGHFKYINHDGYPTKLKDGEYFSRYHKAGDISYYRNHVESPSGKAIDLLKVICSTLEEKLTNAKTNIQKAREETESQKTTMTGLLLPVPLALITGTLCITILLMSSAPVLSLALPFLAVDLLIGAVLLHFIRDAWKKYADIPNVLDAADRLEKTLKPLENLVFEVRSLLIDISDVRRGQYFLHKKPGTTQTAREEAATSAEKSLAKFIDQGKKLTKILTKNPHHYTLKNPLC